MEKIIYEKTYHKPFFLFYVFVYSISSPSLYVYKLSENNKSNSIVVFLLVLGFPRKPSFSCLLLSIVLISN